MPDLPGPRGQRTADATPDRRRRRLLGWALIVAGVSILAWFGWQFWGTTWVAEQRHRDLVAEVERSWVTGDPEIEADEGRVRALVRIPRFGDEFVVPLLEGTSDDALAAGLGRFTEGAEPGRPGNFALAGHRVTHGEPLRAMPELRPGDKVVVETKTMVYTYRLDTAGDALEVSFDAGWVLADRPANPDDGGVTAPDAARLITLTTCAELFHTDERLVAFGHLVGRSPR